MSVVQPETPVFELEDSWEQINAWFLQRDLTDGLPIVPPTEERVRAVTDYVHERSDGRRVTPSASLPRRTVWPP